MKLFLAGSGHSKIWLEKKFYNFYRLQTFYHISKEEAEVIHKYKGFLLDSGAFSMFGGLKVDIKDYVEKYIDVINKYNVEHFFELDIYEIIGVKETEDLRKHIEEKTNKKTIPVWHIYLGVDYYKKLCKEYNYIAIGASGQHDSGWTRKRPEKLKKLVEYANSKKVRVHGLGYTLQKGLKEIPFYSVDSMTWLSGNRFGAVNEFKDKQMFKYDKPKGMRVKTHLAVQNNFNEWVKYQIYLETI
mgnify:FL=1